MTNDTTHSPDPGAGAQAVRHVNAGGRSAILLTGDHAGAAVPAWLDLGVGADDMRRHIAVDIGTLPLGEALARRLDATFVHQHWSRLVIDCNRDPARDDAVPAVSDGTRIPGNEGLSPAGRARRVAAIHAPYHDALAAEVAARGGRCVLVALHSFTPRMRGGTERPWHVGILHDGHEDAVALALRDRLAARGDLVVGDNEPYRMDRIDHSVPRHAFANGLPYAEIEVRQDLIADAAGVARWCAILAEAIEAAVADAVPRHSPGLHPA